MRRTVSFAIALTVAAVVAVPGTAAAQAPGQDLALGSGTATSNVFGGTPWTFDFSAISGPSGENPSGQAVVTYFGIRIDGVVTCLEVSGNEALIGIDRTDIEGTFLQGAVIRITDGGPPESGLDTFDAFPLETPPTSCADPGSFDPGRVTSGDIAINDAPPLPTSKDQCKNGGWRVYGVFKNQGDCVSFVATKGKTPPANSP